MGELEARDSPRACPREEKVGLQKVERKIKRGREEERRNRLKVTLYLQKEQNIILRYFKVYDDHTGRD